MSDKRVFTVDKRGFVSDKPLLTDAVDVTFTYHESGFVPNKHVFMDGDGELPPDKHPYSKVNCGFVPDKPADGC